MDLWQLTIFCKVVELKSFSKAGKAVHLSQPTISSHIKDLENHFGCILIDRLGRKTVPTKSGSLLYKHARKMIHLRDQTESVMAQFNGKIRGRLEAGGSTIPGGYVLPTIVGRFIKSFPDVQVSLKVGDTADILEQVAEGVLELGFVGAQTKDKRIQQEPFIQDDMRIIVPPDHPWANRTRITPEELLDAPFISRETGSGTLKSIHQCLDAAGIDAQKLKVVAEMGNNASVIQGIKYGLGVSIVSAVAVRDDVRSGSLRSLGLAGVDLERTFYITRHKHRSESPLCQSFRNYVEAYRKDWLNTRS
ncbi:MAG: LysR family transcriptional regulator [Deltaproteobacteria bacterium]|nr:MAG: LysR family transcriptional regulator [Deltaproteobacteria bacterium]